MPVALAPMVVPPDVVDPLLAPLAFGRDVESSLAHAAQTAKQSGNRNNAVTEELLLIGLLLGDIRS